MKTFFYLISISAIILSSCGNKEKEVKSKKKPPVQVDVMIARVGEFEKSIEVNGNVLANEMVELRPEVSGRLVYLNITDGSYIESGTVLARINHAELQANLQQQKVEYELAKKNEQRLKSVLEVNGINQTEYDIAVSKVASLDASIKIIEAQIEKTIIRAPFSGTVGLRMVSLGAYITPSTIIASLHQTNKVKIDFSVPEKFESLIKTGTKVSIKGNNSALLMATVSAVEPQINIQTRNIKVRALLNEGILKPGTFVKVSVNLQGKGILVPTNAIIPDAVSNKVVLVKNGRSVYTDITTGERTPDFVEVTEGLSEGDSVIVTGVLFVRNKELVKVRSTKSPLDKNKK